MSFETYQEPVSRLLTLGDFHDASPGEEPNYIEQFGLTDKDIPELIRLATDAAFNPLDSDRVEVWAPIHAWYALAQFQSEAAIAPLISLFANDDDFVNEEMPNVFGQIGAIAIPALADYLADTTPNEWARNTAASCILSIAEADPTSRAAAIVPLMAQLEQYAENGGWLNSTLIDALTQLQAVEAAPLIEQAFGTGEIDEFLTGSWANVQVELGLKQAQDFTPEELRPTPPPALAKLYETVENVGKMLQVQAQAKTKPAGFGAGAPQPVKKKKKKK